MAKDMEPTKKTGTLSLVLLPNQAWANFNSLYEAVKPATRTEEKKKENSKV